MNIKAISYYLANVLKLQSLFMLAPTLIAVAGADYHVVKGFMVTIIVMLLVAVVLDGVREGRAREEKQRARQRRSVYVKDGFVVVAFCWLSVSLFGALPYFLSGEIPSFMDSLFEAVSGFTTTGSTILADIEAMSSGLLFWRSFTHWIGGMGVLVFLLAASSAEHSVNVMKAESSGPMPGKLVPRLRQSSVILYGIYVALTLLQVILLFCGGMPLFDSFCCAMATAGTGGFYIKSASFYTVYGSLYIEMVITFFMVLFGINFNMIYFLLIRNFRGVLRSEEFRVYIGIFAGVSLLIAGNLFWTNYCASFGTALRFASFQTGSMMTTTGFFTDNFDLWPQFSRMLLMIVMMVGASAGSTGGGIKVARLVILIKEAKRIFKRMAHPRSVGIVKLDGKAVDKVVVHFVTNYFILFSFLTIASILLVSLDNFDFESTVTAVLACIGNAGPGLSMVSPVGSYAEFSLLSKVVLTVNMLIGRLEIYPILLLFVPSTWRKM